MIPSSTNPRLLLVIPCYREAQRLPLFLPGLGKAFEGLGCLIQVVDDGSPAVEVLVIQELIEKLRQQFPAEMAPLLKLSRNQGKGAAIRAGWLAHPDILQLAFVDADGSISPKEVRRVFDLAMVAPEQAYFASRIKMLGHQVQRQTTRHLLGRVFATLASFRLCVDAYDTQCGLKIVPASVFQKRPTDFEENGFAFDLELLVALLEQGIPIREIPIDWKYVPGSKIDLIRDSIKMALSIDRIARRRSKWTSQNKTN